MPDERYPLPDKGLPQTPTAWAASVEAGLRTIETQSSGTSDPSTGHSWGAAQRGVRWKDTTTLANPRYFEWELLSTGPDTYGWRELAGRKIRYLTTPAAITTTTASGAAADVPYEDLALASVLEGEQDGGQTGFLVSEAIIRVQVQADAAETLGASDGYVAIRTKGGTNEQRVYAPRDGGLGGREGERTLTVPLDSNEKAEFSAKVGGGGTPNFLWTLTLIGFQEPCG